MGCSTDTFMDAYLEGKRRWTHKHGAPQDFIDAVRMEHSACIFAERRFPSRGLRKMITDYSKTIKRCESAANRAKRKERLAKT